MDLTSRRSVAYGCLVGQDCINIIISPRLLNHPRSSDCFILLTLANLLVPGTPETYNEAVLQKDAWLERSLLYSL